MIMNSDTITPKLTQDKHLPLKFPREGMKINIKPRQLDILVSNLVGFGNLWYVHKSDIAAKANWNPIQQLVTTHFNAPDYQKIRGPGYQTMPRY